jgi:hypothetical protein|tara:strand:+ start:89 stop:211 length:123 start_codon:yes stop_codon:yes gene_type:complete
VTILNGTEKQDIAWWIVTPFIGWSAQGIPFALSPGKRLAS